MQNRGGPGPDELRNMFLAIGLSLAIFLGFEFFYNAPQRARLQAEERARVEQQVEASGERPTTATPAAPPTREQTIAATATARVPIQTEAVDGSISLIGARIDDLNLRTYRRAIEAESPEVTLLAPAGTQFGHDAFFGWEQQAGENATTLAGADTPWTAAEGQRLTPQTPITLTLDAGNGVTIQRTISIDGEYMMTIADTVTNAGATPVSVRPFGTVRRQGMPQDYHANPIVHQGLIGAFGPENHLQQVNFSNADKHARDKARGRAGENERLDEQQGQGGWFGLTDHYWLTAIIPDQNERVSAYFDSRPENNVNDYRAAYRGHWREAAPGQSVTYTQRLFAGAKRLALLESYQNSETSQPIPHFDDAIDWGNFWFLTRPYFALMHWLQQIVGNFGIAILLTTIVVKLLLFPLVYHSFKSMAKMRALQPKMKELQERYAADKQRQQQELLKLYQTEKINPVSGCLPMLLQIPVFYALYKTLTVTIEMRHAPFYGWIHDLSARDPTSIFNLFGLLPYDPSHLPLIGGFLMIGAWPIMYGISMWALQKLSPPMGDPMQAQIFAILPIIFTFMFANFAAGLVIYWTWSNVLSMLQQYVIMRRQGVETQLDTWLKKRFGKNDDDSGGGAKRSTVAAK